MSLNNIKIIGLHPATAVNHILNLYDGADNEEKMKILMKDYDVSAVPSNEIPKKFSSKQMIDIRAGEMLGVGIIGLYYSIFGQFENRTFQVAVGIEDALKLDIEKILVDGALWENETRQKMPFQQTLVQGYYPVRDISTSDVIKAINHKIAMRSGYPTNCGLIVSVFSDGGQINFKEVIDKCKLDEYQQVYILAYDMPTLDTVTVTKLEVNMSAKDFQASQRIITLPRSPSGEWLVNDDQNQTSSSEEPEPRS